MKIGIFGGSFNPLHFSHLFIAEDALERMNLNKIIFVPTGNPPHKKIEISPELRLKMLKLAIDEEDPHLEISEIEVFKKETCYVIDTLKELKKIYPNDEFHLIIGTDSANDMMKWKNPKGISDICESILVYNRLGYDSSEIANHPKYLKKKMVFINTNWINTSSTKVRDLIKNKIRYDYLVPKIIFRFIEDNNLYR